MIRKEPEPPPLRIPARFNLATALVDERLTRGDGARVAIETPQGSWTYARTAELVNRAASALRQSGVTREQRVLICLPDSPEYVAAFLGAIKAGAVAVPCSTFLGAAEYAYFLRQARAPVLITTGDLLARMGGAVAESDLRTVVLTDRAADDGRVRAWSGWMDRASPTFDAADTSKDEPAFWLWTSGSTGEPKAAVHLHQDAPWCCHLVGHGVFGIAPADRVFSAAKLFHAYGLGNALLFPFWAGAATILLPDRAAAEAVYATIDRARPSIFFGVPTLYASMLQIADAEQRFDLSSLRFSVSAGEPLPAELYVRWRDRFGHEILDGIGSTELLNMYIASRPGRVKPGSSGLLIPGYDVRIVKEDGTEARVSDVGDLLVRGPSTAIVYWNQRDQTKRKMQGEWFVTGDKYRVDEDGYYWYAGRADDMFKVAGEWVSPVEVESALIAHASVVECAVVPTAEASGLLKPKAFVVLRNGIAAGDEIAGELSDFVRDRLAHYKVPRAIAFLPELPKTATGKIQRYKLRAL